jgi:hypothetical protein
MSGLLRDLISIPEQIHQGDFVLSLADGLERAEQTLRQYVVTPQLAECFDNALGFIQSALTGRTSKAAYLHASFGAGKSHFMAVLNLLLAGHHAARAVPELGPVIARHPWMERTRTLLVPFHMIGASSMESAVLAGYVEHVRRIHPDAPIPAVYRGEDLIRDARVLRTRMGDAAFFQGLNEDATGGTSGGGDWGELDAGWDAESFERAALAAPGEDDRNALLNVLLRTHFRSYGAVVRESGESMVDLDDGLSIISRHARALGYDAVVLFLDELILWLASNANNLDFINRESQKLAKLVESQHAVRPAPIVSFVARQRDLRELVGDAIAGSEQVRLTDTLKWFEGRFHRINLEDRNLPTIVARRLLQPRDAAARATLDEAFERVTRVRQEVLDTLLTHDADRGIFRQVYPFSPALVQALVALSAVLQRERTALRVLQQLLVEQRDRLQVGDLIPVSDLWDVIARGAEPFAPEMGTRFAAARKFFAQTMVPLLEAEHGVKLDTLPEGDKHPIRQDARLIKTLLLAALVPEVEALRDLTPVRLAALNHGTIRSPIPGREAGEVLRRIRHWASRVQGFRLTGDEGNNPVISIALHGVDVQSLLSSVDTQDNEGNRKRKLKELLFQALGLADPEGELFTVHRFAWRGTARSCEIHYANVRELHDTTLDHQGEGWRLILDFPFDSPGHTPEDDVARAERFVTDKPAGARTLLWLPQFFSAESQRDLGLLVRIDYLLTGGNFDRHAVTLNPGDRQEARELLRHQQGQLRGRLTSVLAMAYGLGNPDRGALDSTHEHRQYLLSLQTGFVPRLPGTGRLSDALANVLEQAFAHVFPQHPRFTEEVKIGALKRVWQAVEAACGDPDRRTLVEKTRRAEVKSIVEPLGLGEMGETHFVVGHRFRDDFEKRRSLERVESPSVRMLRNWLNPDGARTGLTREVADLVILTYAAQTNRAFRFHGTPHDVDVGELKDDLVLATVALPDDDTWASVRERVVALFGLQAPELVNPANVDRIVMEAKQVLANARELHRVNELLVERARLFGVTAETVATWPRHIAGAAVLALHAELGDQAGSGFCKALGAQRLACDAVDAGATLKRAADVLTALKRDDTWSVLGTAAGLRTAESEALVDALLRELRGVDHRAPLGKALDTAFPQAMKMLRPAPPVVVVPPVERPAPTNAGGVLRAGDWSEWDRLADEIEHIRRTHPEARITFTWQSSRSGA